MTSERIDEILKDTAYPESRSVNQALLKVWNECQQEHNKQLTLTDVSQQRKLLIAELNKTDLEYIHQQGCTDILAEDLLRAINCGITPVYGA